jgi:hypothetical protein
MTVTNAFDWDEHAILLNGNTIEIDAKQTLTKGETFLANATSGDIVLGKNGSISADSSTTGTPIILAASGSNGKFINNNGSKALSTGSKARWLVYSYNPSGDTFGSLDSHNTAIWDTVYSDGSSISQTGNRYVFAYQPTVTFTPGNLSKTYGADNTAQVAADHVTPSALQPGVGNAFLGDTAATAYSGSPVVTSAGSPATANAGSYNIDVKGLSGINGYLVAYAPGTLTVDRAALTIMAKDQIKTYGSTFTFAGTEFTPGTLYNGDTVSSVSLTSAGAAGTATVSGSPYAIKASGAVGAGLSNYSITYVDGGLTVHKAPLTITADNETKTFGTTFIFNGTEYSNSKLYNNDAISNVSLSSAGAGSSATAALSPYPISVSNAVGSGLSNYDITYVAGSMTVGPFPNLDSVLERSKAPGRKGPTGTLLSIVNNNVVPTGNLSDLAPAAGGDTALADLAPAAGGTGSGITPLIQCNEVTPCGINQ